MYFTNLFRIHFLFHEFTFNPLSFSRFEYTLSLLSICFLFREFNSNSPSLSRIHLHFLSNFCEFTFNSQEILYRFQEFFFDSLSSQFNFEFTLFIANALRIPIFFAIEFTFYSLFFRSCTFNSLSASRIHMELPIFFANSPWIYNLIRESTLNSLSFSQIHFAFTINLTSSLSIFFLYREFTCNSLFDFCELTFN